MIWQDMSHRANLPYVDREHLQEREAHVQFLQDVGIKANIVDSYALVAKPWKHRVHNGLVLAAFQTVHG
jgi:hypothetical protein